MKDKKVLQGLIESQPMLEIQNDGDIAIISGTYQINETFGDGSDLIPRYLWRPDQYKLRM